MDARNLNPPDLLNNCAMNWTPNLLHPNGLASNTGTLNSPLLNDMHPDLTAMMQEINNNDMGVDVIEPADVADAGLTTADLLNILRGSDDELSDQDLTDSDEETGEDPRIEPAEWSYFF
ncbi:uncharacterized protein LOC125224706 [Leguminivora glycinivorella]|uniref:uncharacterized protein LOC125224706 n=1 Tax=Leguminivora glycinivorella TaxID=1035111 RepID=UPI00200DF1EC|nr:uncharacterized protein LOC125224706 [Leguminivora glycinivorella]